MLPGRTNAAIKNFWYAFTRQSHTKGGDSGSEWAASPMDSGACFGEEEEDDDGAEYCLGEEEQQQHQGDEEGAEEGLQGYEEGEEVSGQKVDAAAGQGGAAAGGAFEGALLPAPAALGVRAASSGGASGCTSGRPPLRIKLGRGMGLAMVGTAGVGWAA
jgi:hypothetical protein